MQLNRNELRQLREYLAQGVTPLAQAILAKIEVGVWVFPGSRWMFPPIDGIAPAKSNAPARPFVIIGSFGAIATQQILEAFKVGMLPYLMVRTLSWEVYLNCSGEVLTEHCDEDLDAVRAACERLRERCGKDVPGVGA